MASGVETEVQRVLDLMIELAGTAGIRIDRIEGRRSDIPRAFADVGRLRAFPFAPRYEFPRQTLGDMLSYYGAFSARSHSGCRPASEVKGAGMYRMRCATSSMYNVVLVGGLLNTETAPWPTPSGSGGPWLSPTATSTRSTAMPSARTWPRCECRSPSRCST